jgi:small subunit ribosomal protein S16
MPVKIRLARHGRKRNAFYHIVVADSRSPRDGKYIERIGSYNPNTNPATINLDFDKAINWLGNGAQPTDTARAILSYEGVMMKKHLLDGVKKGAFDEATAEVKYEAWKKEKDAKINAKKDGLSKNADDAAKARLEAETKINTDRAEIIAKRVSDAEAIVKAEEAAARAEKAEKEAAKEAEKAAKEAEKAAKEAEKEAEKEAKLAAAKAAAAEAAAPAAPAAPAAEDSEGSEETKA